MTPTFIMLCGLPGSGKSRFASEYSKLTGFDVYSSDAIREELYGEENSQVNNDEVFKVLHLRIKESLKSGISAIYDATNINSKRRRAFVSELKNINCTKSCVIIATPYSRCIENNFGRERKVPVEVIKRMYMNWNTPYYFEGWNQINIVHYHKEEKSIFDWCYEMRKYNQDNLHHKHTLGIHCMKTANICDGNDLLFCTSLIHDCGKPFTKRFLNSKGECTNVAHYYNHHNVGAYDSLMFSYPDDIKELDVSILVNLHMQPYFWDKDLENREKTINKYKQLWGNRLFDLVMNLHNADVNSH